MEHLDVGPLKAARGTIKLPGSKSISNRVLLLAALAQGETVVRELLDSDDTRVMLAALDKLGVDVKWTMPAEMRAWVESQLDHWGKFAKAAGIDIKVVPYATGTPDLSVPLQARRRLLRTQSFRGDGIRRVVAKKKLSSLPISRPFKHASQRHSRRLRMNSPAQKSNALALVTSPK